jgi:hypothetical protein
MTARDTFTTSVKTAIATKAATVHIAEMTKQTTIDASKSVVGYTTQAGNYANLASAVKTANQAKLDAVYAAEVARQSAVDVARDTLRDSGDKAPA